MFPPRPKSGTFRVLSEHDNRYNKKYNDRILNVYKPNFLERAEALKYNQLLCLNFQEIFDICLASTSLST